MVGTLIRRPGTLTTGPITSGVYVPTHFLGSNLSASTSYQAIYLRVGDRVIVSGIADLDPVAVGAYTVLGLSFPVASDIASAYDCSGNFAAWSFTETGQINGDATNNYAVLTCLAVTTSNHQIGFVFQYRVM